ncbi:MAG: hypothetical protein WCT53_04280 [Candidatus Gracilibacteria bacterium]
MKRINLKNRLKKMIAGKIKMFFTPKNRGVALLPMIIAMSFIVLVIVLSLSSMGMVETNLGVGQKKADDAFFVANAGVSDGMMKVVRNKNYSSAGYDLTVGNGTANIVVETSTPSSGKSTITSTGTVGTSKRKIQVVVSISDYGKVTNDSWTEVAP